MLIRVNATANNNKFYELSKIPGGSTLARWRGIGGASVQSRTYLGHRSFTAKYQEKIGKGYEVFDGGHGHWQRRLTSGNADQLQRRVSAGLFPSGV